MSEIVLPPCPNWFLPGVLTCGEQGLLVYGSRNNIIICRHKPDMKLNDTVSVSIISGAHKERVNTVRLSTASAGAGNLPDTVATFGDDSIIKLWDIHSHGLVLEQMAHVGQGLVAMDWSRANPDLIVSVDKQGMVVFWNLHSNTVQKLTIQKLSATCLACSPHQSDIVAVGSHRGLVNIISSKDRGCVVHRMRGHDEEVCALAWCPVDYNTLCQDKQQEALLASGCKGRQVFVWRTLTDGRMQAKFTLLPHPFSSSTRFAGTGGTSTFYLCLLWPEPTTLLTTALFGELLSWDLSRLAEDEKAKTTISNMFPRQKKGWPPYVRMLHDLPRAAYTMACPPYVMQCDTVPGDGDGEDGPDCKGSGDCGPARLVWTLGQDRYLVACNLSTGKLAAKIPTFSSAIYSIAVSPLDPGRISIGVGDAAIRVWNLNNTEQFEVTCFWQRIKNKVLSLAWHPLKENVLAFATGEGRVGLLTVTGGKPPIVFKMQHHGSVYSMCWGPYTYSKDFCPEKIPEVALYTCGSGEIFQFDPSSPDDLSVYPMEMMKQLSAEKKAVQGSELVWKSDNTIFAAGLSDGSVHLFSAPHLVLLHSVYSVKKYIQMLAWHPESTATDSGFSPYCNWLAVAANEKTIRVFNFTPIVESLQDGDGGTPKATIECCSVLNGHEDKVPCICWNPHISGQLVSVSYDSTAVVWDVPSQTVLVVFAGHDGSLFSCLWSPLDPDLIFTGGTDATLQAWRVSKQTYRSVQELVAQRKHALKRLKRTNEVVEKQLQQEAAESVELSGSTSEVKSVQVTEPKRAKQKSILCSVKPIGDDKMELYLDACRLLLEHSGEESISCVQHEENFPLFAVYGDREAVCRLVDKEASGANESPGIAENVQHFEVWKGNIAELLKTAAREKKLSTFLLSLAPLASPRLWLEMCKAYADQLSEAGHVQKAASYLVACHKLEEAITLLVERDRYAEALILAKFRGADPAVVCTILRKWASKMASDGKAEYAAERLLAVGELGEACKLYARSKHMASHRFAALVASKAGLPEKAESIARDALEEHLIAEKWDVANCIIAEHPSLKPLAVLVKMQQLVVDRTGKGSSSTVLWHWLTSSTPEPSPSLLDEVATCATLHQVSREQLTLALGTGHAPANPKEPSGQLWLEVSRGLCLAWAAAKQEQMLRHLVKATDAVYQVQLHCTSQPPLLALFCCWLAPAGPLADGSVFCGASCPLLVQSLRAYLCAALVFWLEGLRLDDTNPPEPGKLVQASRDGHHDGSCEASNSDDVREASNSDDVQVKDDNREANGEGQTGGSDRKWGEACRILGELVDDVVNMEAVSYFKAELQIKKLSVSLALAVAGGAAASSRKSGDMDVVDPSVGKPVCESADCETGQEKPDCGDADETKVPVGVNKESEAKELISNEVDVVVSVAVESGVEEPSRTVSGEKQRVADEPVVQSGTNAVFSELEELKRGKETFEAARLSIPNPYFSWFKLHNLCQTLLSEHEPEAAEQLRSHLVQLRSSYLE